jgi:SEC-C motif
VPRHDKDSDPRRRARAVNPLSEFAPAEPCWCASGQRYEDCHMIGQLSPPGAATPPDTDDAIHISPNTTLRRDALVMPATPVPVLMQQPTPQAPPVTVEAAVRAIATAKPAGRALSFREIGSLRFALLDTHGIRDPAAVRAGRHDQVIDQLIPDLASGALQLARATVDRLATDLASDQPPVVLNSDHGDIVRLVGQSLLWADHYLISDSIAEAAAAGRGDLPSYRMLVADLLDIRSLVESGIVVPAFFDLAIALIDTEIDAMVAADLGESPYVEWAEQQIVLEGPSAREAAFVHVTDDYPHDWIYLHGRNEPIAASQSDNEPLKVRSKLLNHYDPSYDYDPWLATVKRQTVAKLTKALDTDLAVSSAFGADLLTTSPFRARALQRLHVPSPGSSGYDISGAAWAEVPWLPNISAELLVKIAASEDRVDDLRRATATALRAVQHGDVAASASAIADVAADLTSAAGRLGRDLRRQSSIDLALPAGVATGSVLLAGTLAPVIGLGALLAGAVPAIPAARKARLTADCRIRLLDGQTPRSAGIVAAYTDQRASASNQGRAPSSC